MLSSNVMTSPVEDAILECELLPGGTRVIAAVSGGADSMAMLDALQTHKDRLGIAIVVGSFDHCLHRHSARDLRRVGEWCAAHATPFHAGRGDVAAHARSTGASIEAAARELRYAFLEQMAQQLDAARIATAHTRDDQVETVLMRLERGAGVRGLVGIHRERGVIVRPLLDVTRSETHRHCIDHDVPFVDDPGNADTRFERNRIRHETLPALRLRNPATDEKLLRIRHVAMRTVTRIRERTAPLLDSAVAVEGNARVVNAAALEPLGTRERYVFFGDLLTERMRIDGRPDRAHYRLLAQLCDANAPTGRMVTFPGGCARREYGTVVLFPGVRHPDEYARTAMEPVVLSAQDNVHFDGYALRVHTVSSNSLTPNDLRAAGKSTGPGEAAVAYFGADSLELPLVVRHTRPGDRMQPFGMPGHRTLGDILSDHKVPPRHRRRALIVEDQRRIIWLVGVTTSESTRVEPHAPRVVRIDIDGGTSPE